MNERPIHLGTRALKYTTVLIIMVTASALLALWFARTAEAQAAPGDLASLAWIDQFGSNTNDVARSVAVDPEGNVYSAGNTEGALGGSSAGGVDAFVRKHLAVDGGPGWTRQFGSTSSDDALDVAVDRQGNVYVSGSGNPRNLSVSGGFIRKYDANGNTSNDTTGPVWTKQFNGGTVRNVAVDNDGNVYIALNINSDVYMYKFRPDGSLEASAPFGAYGCYGPLSDISFGAAVGTKSDDQSVYVTGITAGQELDDPNNCEISTSEDQFYLIKFDGALTKRWDEQFGGPSGSGVAIDVAVDSDNNAYVTGYINGQVRDKSQSVFGVGGVQNSIGGQDSFLFKFSSTGYMQYAKQFGTSGNDLARGLALGSDGALYIAGNTTGSFEGATPNQNPGTGDVFVNKRSQGTGERLLTRQFGSTGNDSVGGTAYDWSSGGVVVTGNTDGSLPGEQNAGGRDAFVVKTGRTNLVVEISAPGRLETGEFNNLVGNPFDVEATVRNTGDATLTNLNASFSSSPTGLTATNPSSTTIETLEPGQSKTVGFTVEAYEPKVAQDYSMTVPISNDIDAAMDSYTISVPTSGHSYVAVGDSTTTGYSVITCNSHDGTSGYQFKHGCKAAAEGGENRPADPYPELVAQELSSTVNPRFNDLNRVGVWGYTTREATKEYDDAELRGDQYRDGTHYQSQLHAVAGARDLVTVSLGANDMGFSTVGYWLDAYAQSRILYPGPAEALDEAARVRYEGGISPIDGKEYPGTQQFIRTMLDDSLVPASNNGADIIVTQYPNVISDQTSCSVLHTVSEEIVTTLNAGIIEELRRANEGLVPEDHIETVSFYDPWKADGADHGIGATALGGPTVEPWAFGTSCDWLGLATDQVPDLDYNGYRVEAQESADPHPNQAGAEAMTEAVANRVKEMRQ